MPLEADLSCPVPRWGCGGCGTRACGSASSGIGAAEQLREAEEFLHGGGRGGQLWVVLGYRRWVAASWV